MGVIAHEFGHTAFGFPHEDTGQLSLMGAGCLNGPNGRGACPSGISPIMRLQEEWVAITQEISASTITTSVDLNYNYTSPIYLRINIPHSQDNEYFIVENRLRDGYDQYTPNDPLLSVCDPDPLDPNGNEGGLLIWRSGDYEIPSTSALDQTKAYFANPLASSGGCSIAFPYGGSGPGGNDQDMDDLTIPALDQRSGEPTNVSISSIHWSNASHPMTFDVSFYQNSHMVLEVQTWTTDETFNTDIIITDGATLTIEQGVDICFDNLYQSPSIKVIDGNLVVQGTQDSPVTFSGINGFWGGVDVVNGDLDVNELVINGTNNAINMGLNATAQLVGLTISGTGEEGIALTNYGILTVIDSEVNSSNQAVLNYGTMNLDNVRVINSGCVETESALTVNRCWLEGTGLFVSESASLMLSKSVLLSDGNSTAARMFTEDASFLGNTFYNWNSGIFYTSEFSGDPLREDVVEIKNNIFMNISSVAVNLGVVEPIMNNNSFFNNENNGYEGNVTTNVELDPLFLDPDNNDYHLQSTSPCIDAGDPATPLDPDNSIADIGAYYYDRNPLNPILMLGIQSNHPLLTWSNTPDVNGYEDEDIDHYKIYKKYYISKFNQMTSYVNNYTDMSYIDYGFGVSSAGSAIAYYKVMAYDHLNQPSSWSNTRSTQGYIGMNKPSFHSLPEDYSLSSAYPNPFNPTTTIEYALPLNSNTNIMIFDIMGHLVSQELIANQQAGYYQFIWNGTNLYNKEVSSGIYLITIKAVGVSERENYSGASELESTEKVMYLK